MILQYVLIYKYLKILMIVSKMIKKMCYGEYNLPVCSNQFTKMYHLKKCLKKLKKKHKMHHHMIYLDIYFL